VLDDDGFVLWESRAIMQYLADQTPGQTLWPAQPRARADVSRWLFWCAAHMAPANAILVQENFVKPLAGRGAPDPVELARGSALFVQHAGILDAHLAGKTWISGDHLTLADYSLAAGFALAGPARFPIADFAHVRAWLGRVQELDAWQRTTPQLPPKG
jgi:glutathione S-transferase